MRYGGEEGGEGSKVYSYSDSQHRYTDPPLITVRNQMSDQRSRLASYQLRQ